MQTQVLYRIVKCLNCLSSMKFAAGIVFRAGTIVDFVSVKTPGFNTFNTPRFFAIESKGVPCGGPGVEHLVPNHIQNFVEPCGILLFASD
jgi:hypothetical protein